MKLSKYSLGTGDRFGKEAPAQLEAVRKAAEFGKNIAIVWNKSHREHEIIHTKPLSVRTAADKAVKEAGWKEAYYVDADHIEQNTVEDFIDSSDFFTLDVADFIGKAPPSDALSAFMSRNRKYLGEIAIPGMSGTMHMTEEKIRRIGEKYLAAVKEAKKIYNLIASKKGVNHFITEVSMDETDEAQTPEELLFILSAIADEEIPLQTIAPKFSGRFNKGVDYVGDVRKFDGEFNDDVLLIKWAIKEFKLPDNLKLSIHSGSDKFSLYPHIRKSMKKHNVGIHIKTAGTTWLEEVIGLAESGGNGLEIAKKIYSESLKRYDELTAPYATVIDINRKKLPAVDEVNAWDGSHYASVLRHNQSDGLYNPNFRQLLHVGYKVASEMGEQYLKALVENASIIGRNVTMNLFDRHIKPLFLD